MLARSRWLFLQSQVTLISDVDRSKQQVETLHKASMDMNMSIFVKGKVKRGKETFVKRWKSETVGERKKREEDEGLYMDWGSETS